MMQTCYHGEDDEVNMMVGKDGDNMNMLDMMTYLSLPSTRRQFPDSQDFSSPSSHSESAYEGGQMIFIIINIIVIIIIITIFTMHHHHHLHLCSVQVDAEECNTGTSRSRALAAKQTMVSATDSVESKMSGHLW